MTAPEMNLDLMEVEQRRELLNAYLDGELSAEEALQVSTWLDENPGALREVEHLRHLWDLLENYSDEPVPAEFAAQAIAAAGVRHDSLRGHAKGQGDVVSGRVIPMAWYRRPLASAAAVLVAVGATVFVMQRSDDGEVPVPKPVTDVVSVLKDVPADQLGELLLNADVLLSVDDAALDEDYDEEGVAGG